MMQTWMDQHIYGLVDEYRSSNKNDIPNDIKLTSDVVASAISIMESHIKNASQTPNVTWSHGHHYDTEECKDALRDHIAILHLCMLQFLQCRNDIDNQQLCAIKPTNELISVLSRANPPSTESHIPLLKSALWYIDIPHSSIIIGNREVRSIFVLNRSSFVAPCIFVVLSPKGQNAITSIMQWWYGIANSDCRCVSASIVHFDDIEYCIKSINNLIALLLLYKMSADKGNTAILPRIDADQLAKSSLKKQQARRKTHSLFRVIELRPPIDRFGRSDSDTREGWRLDHRVAVRGHFRWQAHGPNHTLRRLQWIDAYSKGPQNTPEKIGIEILR